MIAIQPSMRGDVHDGRTRLVIPLIDPLRQLAFREWPQGRGGLCKKIRYSARAPPAATRRRDRCERAGDLLQRNPRWTRKKQLFSADSADSAW